MSKGARKRNARRRAGSEKAAKRGGTPARQSASTLRFVGETHPLLEKRHFIVAVAIVLVTVAVFAPVRSYGFISLDDPQYVSENPIVALGLTRESLAWAFKGFHASYWIPLDWLSHMLDVQLFGLNAGAHHLVNLLLHVIDALLLYGLLYRLTGGLGRSALVAALFAVHPLHVESVVWITERKDVLSTFFWLLSLWAYVGYARKPGVARYGAVAALFCLGLMVKPMLVTLPIVLLILDFWPLGRWRTRGEESAATHPSAFHELKANAGPLILEKIPLFVISIGAGALTVVSQSDAIPGLGRIPAASRMANATVSYVTYLLKMVWPSGLVPFYPYPASTPAWKVLLSAATLVGITLVAIKTWRRHPYLAMGWLWYVVVLFPVSGVVQAGLQSMADRFTYVPLIGIFVCMVWGAHDLLERARNRGWMLMSLGVAVVVPCALAARHQVGYWRSELVLWQHALDAAPESYVAHANLGIALQESGDVSGAIPHYHAALRLRPNYSRARNNLAVALANQGNVDQAIEQFRQAVRYEPNLADLHYNLAVLLARRGDTTEAVQHLRDALRLAPRNDAARAELERLTR